MKEIYISIDVETDGPVPLQNSLLSIGAAAFKEDGTLLDTFEANLEKLPSASEHPETMKWWSQQKEAWEYLQQNKLPAEVAMASFDRWVRSFVGQKVAVCAPSGFDFTYVYVYTTAFLGSCPFGFSCVDLKSFVMAGTRKKYAASGKSCWPQRWQDSKIPHTHKAIDDAIEQGLVFLKARQEFLSGKKIPLLKNTVSENFWKSVKSHASRKDQAVPAKGGE